MVKEEKLWFSTQVSSNNKGTNYLAYYLERMNFDVIREEIITMPNNYYFSRFKKVKATDIQKLKKECMKNSKNIISLFLKNEEKRNEVSDSKIAFKMWFYNKFKNFSKNWARKKLSVDMKKCIKCKKCESGCITGNIKVEDEVLFGDKCIKLPKMFEFMSNKFIFI